MTITNKNILILTYWNFEDALIQTYTLPYVKIIADELPISSNIFLLTLEKKNKSTIKFSHPKIKIISIPYRSFGLIAILLWIKTLYKLLRLIKKEGISTIHAWCTPAGMIGYVLSKISKKELIIDSYEPHAEAMVENGEWKENGFVFKLLFKFEKLMTHHARYLIAIDQKMPAYAQEKYGFVGKNYFFKPACVNLNLFSFSNRKQSFLIEKYNLHNKIIAVYAGKFGGIYLDKEVFDFFKVAESYWNDKFKVILLTSTSDTEIQTLISNSGLKKETVIKLFVPHSEIADYIGLGDFAITPVKPIYTKRFCSPIKDGEYWALGLPIVITSNISSDSEIIEKNAIGSVLHELNYDAYLNSIIQIDKILKQNSLEELYSKIRPFAEKYRNFSIAKNIYSQIYS